MYPNILFSMTIYDKGPRAPMGMCLGPRTIRIRPWMISVNPFSLLSDHLDVSREATLKPVSRMFHNSQGSRAAYSKMSLWPEERQRNTFSIMNCRKRTCPPLPEEQTTFKGSNQRKSGAPRTPDACHPPHLKLCYTNQRYFLRRTTQPSSKTALERVSV